MGVQFTGGCGICWVWLTILKMLLRFVCFLSIALSFAKLPEFSWDTVPVFFHSGNESGLYSEKALQIIAKYPMVTIEKFQSYQVKNIDDEDDMVAVMKAVKEVNPNVATYFYMNSFKDRPEMTRMARQFDEHPEWALRNDDGIKVKNTQGYYVFDLSNSIVRKWWLDTCLNATKLANGDGCFCDSSQHSTGQGFNPPISDEKMKAWGDGLLTLTKDVQSALGDDKLLIGKVPDQPYVKAVQIETFSANNKSINDLMLGVKNGKVIQAHIQIRCTEDITNFLAAFLIGAGQYSYFGCGAWQSTGNGTEPLTWKLEYDKPLGAPLSDAMYSDRKWKREFSKGTIVEFDTLKNIGKIQWGT